MKMVHFYLYFSFKTGFYSRIVILIQFKDEFRIGTDENLHSKIDILIQAIQDFYFSIPIHLHSKIVILIPYISKTFYLLYLK